MATRNVVLTPAQDALVERLVASGRFQNASEVLRSGLRLLEEQEADLDDLRRAADGRARRGAGRGAGRRAPARRRCGAPSPGRAEAARRSEPALAAHAAGRGRAGRDRALDASADSGQAQADIYETELIGALRGAGAGRPRRAGLLGAGRARADGLRFIRAGRHFVVYIEIGEEMVVLDVVHGRADLPRRLKALRG